VIPVESTIGMGVGLKENGGESEFKCDLFDIL
jgi:hypothetical protein